MKEDLSRDLRLSRKGAGLSGNDLAHLLGCNAERISRLENGHARISGEEMAALALIYGKEPSQWLYHLTRTIAGQLKDRLSVMPDEPSNWAQYHDARLDTLIGLTHRLQVLSQSQHDA